MTDPVGEGLAYAVAVVILVTGGMLMPSVVLNWIVGPTILVVTVAVLAPVLSKRRWP